MKFAPLAITLTALTFLPITSLAQTQTWEERVQSLEQETDITKQKKIYDDAIKLATSATQKFDTNLNFADIKFQQRQYAEAIYYSNLALQIADKDLPDNQVKRTKAVVRKSESLRKSGHVNEAVALISDDVRRKSQKSTHIWKPYTQGTVHRFSGLTCPDFVSKMPRDEFHNFNAVGTDVGCSYKLLSDKYNLATIYLTRYGQSFSDKAAIKGGGGAFLNRNLDAPRFAEEDPAEFKSVEGRPVYYSLISYGTPQQGENYTGAWTQVIDNWIMKTRVTWDSDLGRAFGAEKSEALFAQAHDNIRAHFDSCKASETKKTGTHIANDESMSVLAMEVLFASISIESENKEVDENSNSAITDKENPAQNSIIPTPKIECFTHKSSGNEVALGYHPNEQRRYSLYSSIVDTILYVEKTNDLTKLGASQKEQFSLKSIRGKTVTIFNIYDGEPPALLVFQDMVKVINNKASMLGSITYDDDKNVSVNISPPL